MIIFVILINGICMIYVYNFLIFSCILESKKYFVCVYEILSFEGLCINSLYLSNFVFVYWVGFFVLFKLLISILYDKYYIEVI